MGNAASILQSLVQSPEDRLFGYLQAIRHVMDDPTWKLAVWAGRFWSVFRVRIRVGDLRLYFTEKVTQWTRSSCSNMNTQSINRTPRISQNIQNSNDNHQHQTRQQVHAIRNSFESKLTWRNESTCDSTKLVWKRKGELDGIVSYWMCLRDWESMTISSWKPRLCLPRFFLYLKVLRVWIDREVNRFCNFAWNDGKMMSSFRLRLSTRWNNSKLSRVRLSSCLRMRWNKRSKYNPWNKSSSCSLEFKNKNVALPCGRYFENRGQ